MGKAFGRSPKVVTGEERHKVYFAKQDHEKTYFGGQGAITSKTWEEVQDALGI